MARRKKKESEVVETYTTEITYTCPVRGKVTEKVKVKKYKTAERAYLAEVPKDKLYEGVDEGGE